ncbi:unnamed protein product [Schistosoma margrebowiei]|uniref:Uncharacterized protein n=1 Tax=Schistosoma margrebowiei TaxID=48269 RepID=A0A183N0J1_9TREM|nr:unnamed protein product [Schistosoma margrebowiei]
MMPTPTNVSALRSFLGLVSYYSAFVPSMHGIHAPLNSLPQKNSCWNWTKQCDATFCKLKFIVGLELLLTHYDPAVPIIVAAGASAYGLGAVISRCFLDASDKAVMNAARTSTSAETNTVR